MDVIKAWWWRVRMWYWIMVIPQWSPMEAWEYAFKGDWSDDMAEGIDPHDALWEDMSYWDEVTT